VVARFRDARDNAHTLCLFFSSQVMATIPALLVFYGAGWAARAGVGALRDAVSGVESGITLSASRTALRMALHDISRLISRIEEKARRSAVLNYQLVRDDEGDLQRQPGELSRKDETRMRGLWSLLDATVDADAASTSVIERAPSTVDVSRIASEKAAVPDGSDAAIPLSSSGNSSAMSAERRRIVTLGSADAAAPPAETGVTRVIAQHHPSHAAASGVTADAFTPASDVDDNEEEEEEEEGEEIGLLRLAVRPTTAAYHAPRQVLPAPSTSMASSNPEKHRPAADSHIAPAPAAAASVSGWPFHVPSHGTSSQHEIFSGFSAGELGALVVLLGRLAQLFAAQRAHISQAEWSRLVADLRVSALTQRMNSTSSVLQLYVRSSFTGPWLVCRINGVQA
jgi:hypothetical protein